MSLHRPLDLLAPAIIRGDEHGAHQQQDDISLLNVFVDALLPFVPGCNFSIVPLGKDALPLQQRESISQVVPQALVLV